MDVITEFEGEQLAALSAERPIPDFRPGDLLRVNVKVLEGSRSRVQVFEGVCIARKNAGLNSSFTVRKMSYGEGVERVFPVYSTSIDGIDVVRRGAVRRAKLYYLRKRSGKSARIAERVESGGARAKARTAAKPATGKAAPDGAAADGDKAAPESDAAAKDKAAPEGAAAAKDKAAPKRAAAAKDKAAPKRAAAAKDKAEPKA
jgi:large subunit ribosomal protein L19